MISPLEFSYTTRKNWLQNVGSDTYDLVVIGGGITGAGIALDASSRGLKVLLLEKNDFASGTSSKSTKLIHGGLRYLKQMDFLLVREVGTERAVVHRLAPHLVIPEKMLLPLIEDGTYGKWLTSIGLKVYDLLAQVEGEDQRKMLSAEEASQKEPLLPKTILKGAGYYAEYRTDDARLTIEILKTGLHYELKALNYTMATGFLYTNGRISGVRIKDMLSGSEHEVKSRCVVNAAGPWVDEVRTRNNRIQGKSLHLTKGVHLVFPHAKLPVKQAVYFDAPDGRMIFAIPRGLITYVGTTDTNFTGDPDKVAPQREDAQYLLDAVNRMFDAVHLKLDDIESSWAGLRPLIHEEGKSPSELSRKDEIFISDSGLISIAGGKLTGYRKMAERVVNKVVARLPGNYGACKTETISLLGGSFQNYQEVKAFKKSLESQLKTMGLDRDTANHLAHTYGKQSDEILKRMEEESSNNPQLRLLLAELKFTLAYELVLHPLDFLIRRSSRMYFHMESVRRYHREITREILRENSSLPWSNDEINKDIEKEITLLGEFYKTH